LTNAGNMTNFAGGDLLFGESTVLDNSGTLVNYALIATSGTVHNTGTISDKCGGTFVKQAGYTFTGNVVSETCSP